MSGLDIDSGAVFQALGEAGIAALVAGFYAQIPTDPLLGPMYPEGDFAGAEARLRDFLVFRLGGPDRYQPARGHPRLRMRHMPFPIDQAARDRWVELMDRSLAAQGFPAAAAATLREFYAQVATFLINRPGSGGLPLVP